MDKKRIAQFQKTIWDFYKKNKRDFPWRRTADPYNILVSEIMLQQTQTDRVIPYYQKWIKQFPNFESLAKATFGEIYPYWQGLGYNRRALALQKLAKEVVEKYHGKIPSDVGSLEELAGIGPYTARAICIFSFNTPVACIETNIRRVFIHHFFADKDNIDDKEILKIVERALPAGKAREWHWALMDYGAYLKNTIINPNRRAKNYVIQSKFEGSIRQIRGLVLKALLLEGMDVKALTKTTKIELKRIKGVLPILIKEKLVRKDGSKFYLN